MKNIKLFILLILPVVAIVSLIIPTQASAADATSFNAGRIIDDAVFTNSNSMTVAEIQQFLNSKMTTCDVSGQKQSELGGGTRAQWAAARGYSATFTCLRDYYENPSTGENNYGGKAIPGGAISAAQIIYNYSKQFSINPQVIIVTLQKEKGMVTDEWPILKDMREAMGFGCPDNVAPGAPACDPAYGSFSTQIYQAARHFRGYMDRQYCDYNRGWCTPYTLGNNEIQWQANMPSCGTSIVNIQNLATSALYSYTPYRPNQAALNAGYGHGDACSAYGNRNFFLYFSDWFGATSGPAYNWSLSSYGVYLDQALTQKINDKNIVNLAAGQSAYVKIVAQNTGTNTWQRGDLLMGTSNVSSPIYDSSWLSRDRTVRMTEQTVTYGNTGTFTFKITAPNTANTYYQNFNIVIDGLTWFNNVGPSLQLNISQPVTQPSMTTSNMLKSGTVLKNGESINSSDNNTVLRFEYGQLRMYTNFGMTWSTSLPTSNGATLVNQADGNIVIYNADGSAAWASNTSGNGPSNLQVQNDGNLVLYSANAATWASNSAVINQQNRINNILANDQLMFTNQRLVTADRGRILVLQGDGNLVLYTPYRVAWASNTAGSGANRLIMQPDGNLVLYTPSGRPVWASNTAGRGASDVLLQMDSNLVIYGSNSAWSTNTAGR